MMTTADISEFPFVADLPKREAKKVANTWDELRLIVKIIKEDGPPVPFGACALALGVSKQRISQLVAEGRLKTIEYAGSRHVALNSLEEFARLNRVSGRPVGWRKDDP